MSNEFIIDQEGGVVWLYGMSGAGKTTISKLLKTRLNSQGYAVIILDGDEIRAGINQDLGFSLEDRSENIRRVAEMAKLLAANNILVICALITPMQEYRALVRNIVKENCYQIFINCPVAICEQRDVKGLYKLSREKKIKNFTGIDSGFETGSDADLILNTNRITAEEATQMLYTFVISKFS
jgi:adenylylsulfate kinase